MPCATAPSTACGRSTSWTPTGPGALDRYHLYWATRADLERRAGDRAAAATHFAHAADLADNDAERRYLERRHAECVTSQTA